MTGTIDLSVSQLRAISELTQDKLGDTYCRVVIHPRHEGAVEVDLWHVTEGLVRSSRVITRSGEVLTKFDWRARREAAEALLEDERGAEALRRKLFGSV
jgi:hypothetical protein